MALEIVSRSRCFDGTQFTYQHRSSETGTMMRFAAFVPPQAHQSPFPVLWYLSARRHVRSARDRCRRREWSVCCCWHWPNRTRRGGASLRTSAEWRSSRPVLASVRAAQFHWLSCVATWSVVGGSVIRYGRSRMFAWSISSKRPVMDHTQWCACGRAPPNKSVGYLPENLARARASCSQCDRTRRSSAEAVPNVSRNSRINVVIVMRSPFVVPARQGTSESNCSRRGAQIGGYPQLLKNNFPRKVRAAFRISPCAARGHH